MASYLCCQRNEKSKWSGQDGLGSIGATSQPLDFGEYGRIEHAAMLPKAEAANLYSLGAACC